MKRTTAAAALALLPLLAACGSGSSDSGQSAADQRAADRQALAAWLSPTTQAALEQAKTIRLQIRAAQAFAGVTTDPQGLCSTPKTSLEALRGTGPAPVASVEQPRAAALSGFEAAVDRCDPNASELGGAEQQIDQTQAQIRAVQAG